MGKTNRLGSETSPYLLQHKDNPVHWHPWGDNALNEARNQGKPILLSIGYAACQLGTRFIATDECAVHETYRAAILDAEEEDIVLTHRLSGVPCSVIRTPMIEEMGTEAGPIARWLLKNRKTRHWMRTRYALKSLKSLKRSSREGLGYKDVFQAGKSVAGIDEVLPAGEIVRRFRDALVAARA